MEEMTFTELQQRMQLKKKKEGTAKYASRHAEDIYNVLKVEIKLERCRQL